jgi:hypothetical protein
MTETSAPAKMPNQKPIRPATFGRNGGFGISCGSGGARVYEFVPGSKVFGAMMHPLAFREINNTGLELQIFGPLKSPILGVATPDELDY